ncbi:ferritin [Candidatus Omnitrophota bacterium]
MISDRMVERLNHQINREIYSAYFYLGMAAYAETIGMKGTANWFSSQVKEELVHAQKMYDYVNRQGAKVNLAAIEEPPQDFTSVPDLFSKTLEHEKKVTGMIKDLVALAAQEKDEEAGNFLQWFVKEQIEEEATPAGILKKLEGKDEAGILEIDNELAKRVFNIS